MRTPPPVKAFTLVEMLVVISIIAILTALGVAGFQSARSAASTAACVSNLKSMAQAILISSADNNGDLPYGRTSWSGGGYLVWTLYANPSWNCPYAAPPGQYLRKNPVLCPAMAQAGKMTDLSAQGRGFYYSYGLNGKLFVDGTTTTSVPVRLSRITQPSATAMITDLDAWAFAYFSYTRADLNYFRYLHHGAQNVAFVDGHVEALSKTQVPSLSTDTFWTGGLP